MTSNPCATAGPEPIERAFRSNELWARAQGLFEQADYYRQAADSIESGFVHRSPRLFRGLRTATMAGWRLDLPGLCKMKPPGLARCDS